MNPIDVPWGDFKNFLTQNQPVLKSLVINGNYLLHAFDGSYALSCIVAQDGGPNQTDYETNFAALANTQSLLNKQTSVTTLYETNDKYLSMAKVLITVANNTGQIRLKVPGTFGAPGAGRFIAGGYGWMDTYDPDDFILLDVFDDDRLLAKAVGQAMGLSGPASDAQMQSMTNIPGIGSAPNYPQIGTYNDDGLPAANRGWYFWPLARGNGFNAMGEIEFEPIAGYGFLPAGLYLVVTINRPNVAAGVFRGDIDWGASAPIDTPLGG